MTVKVNRDIHAAVVKHYGKGFASLKQVEAVMECFADVVRDNAVLGTNTLVPDFGTFKAIDVPERTVHNPHTRAPMQVEAHRVVRFAASSSLSAAVWASGDQEI